jgi:hypothetical protein
LLALSSYLPENFFTSWDIIHTGRNLRLMETGKERKREEERKGYKFSDVSSIKDASEIN